MKIEAKNKIKEAIEYLKTHSIYDDNINKAIRCINEAIKIIKNINEEPDSPNIPDYIVYDNPTYGDSVISTNGEIYTISKLFDEDSPYYTDNQARDEVYYNNEEQRWYLNKRIGITQTINIDYSSTNAKEYIKLYDANGVITHKVVWGTTMDYDYFGVNVENEKVLTTGRDAGTIPEGKIGIVAYSPIDKFLIRNPNGVSPETVSKLLSNQTIRYYLENEILDIPLLKKGEKISVSSISFKSHAIGISSNINNKKLEYTIYPTTATNKAVNFYSLNENIAKIDNQGNITPVSEGETDIIVESLDGNYSDKIKLFINQNTNKEQLFTGAYIQIYYYNPKPFSDTEVIIPYFIDDYEQTGYQQDNTNKTFTLIVIVDGVETRYENIKAGDNEINLGILSEGEHWFSLQGIDNSNNSYGMRIYKEIWCVNRETYPIQESETYYLSKTDLTNYSINNSNAEDDDSCENTKLGLNQLMINCKNEGFRKLVLLPGTYRVNCTSRQDCIIIPSNFTLDLNGATIKRKPDIVNTTISKSTFLLNNCIDSHIINGYVEDDRQERIDANMDWYNLSEANGEDFNTFYIRGGRYWSLENLKVSQAVGHSALTTADKIVGDIFQKKYKFDTSIINDISEDNIIEKCYILNGIKYYDDNYVTNEMKDLKDWKSQYINFGETGGYSYFRGISQTVYYHFYNERKEFVTSIPSMQYRPIRIPEGCRYVRATILSKASDMEGGMFFMDEQGTNNAIKNNEYSNCRTTVIAPTRSRGLLIEGNSYNECGQKITPSALDFEDGWQQSMDVYYRQNNLISGSKSSATVITVAGVNHVYEGNINHKEKNIALKVYTTGCVVRNNDNIHVNNYQGLNQYACFNRFYDNTNMSIKVTTATLNETSISLGETLPTTVIRNNTIDANIVGDKNGDYEITDRLIYYKCNIKGGADYVTCKECNIYPQPYIGIGTIKMYNCNFYNFDDINTQIRFSFNHADTYRLFKGCSFNSPTWLSAHNNFNSGIFEDCIFNKRTSIDPNYSANNEGDLVFRNCHFKDELEIKINRNDCYVVFENCSFDNGYIFKNHGEANSVFK